MSMDQAYKNSKRVRLRESDLLLLKVICVGGAATENYSNNLVGDRRVRTLIKKGILKKNKPFYDESRKNRNGHLKKLNSLSLDTKGAEEVIKRGFCTKLQGFNGYIHTEQTEKIVEDLLTNKNIPVEKIFNEKEQEDMFKHQIYQAEAEGIDFAINDIAYYDLEDNLHSLEIETNYKKELVIKHKNYAEKVLNVRYESHSYNSPKKKRR